MNRFLRISNLVAVYSIGMSVLFLLIGVYYDNLYIGLIALVNAFLMACFKGHLMNERVLKREASMKYGVEGS